MTRTRTNGNSFSNSVVTGTEGKSATLKSLCSSVYRVDTKTYQPSDIRWLFIQVRLNCYIICKTLPSEKKREIVLYLIMLMHAHTHPFILFVRKDVRSTDVFPVVASLPVFRRERSDDLRFAGYKRWRKTVKVWTQEPFHTEVGNDRPGKRSTESDYCWHWTQAELTTVEWLDNRQFD